MTPSTSVALGMVAEYEVSFRPESDRDYACDLVVATERERFLLPVVARGARLRFELPDVIDCGAAPVKAQTTRSYLLTNVGRKKGEFQIATTGDFAVTPTQAELNVDASVQCVIRFTPTSAGELNGAMTITYANGDTDTVELRGVGQDLEIWTVGETVELPSTYITQNSAKSFSLRNNSATCVRFSAALSKPRSESSAWI